MILSTRSSRHRRQAGVVPQQPQAQLHACDDHGKKKRLSEMMRNRAIAKKFSATEVVFFCSHKTMSTSS